MEEMLTIPGAARKTANVVLGTAYGIPAGVVVDTHVSRIAQRLDLTKNTDPVKVEQDLMKIIPQKHWIFFAHQIILHGRALCVARNPKCAECDLDRALLRQRQNRLTWGRPRSPLRRPARPLPTFTEHHAPVSASHTFL